MEHKKEWVRPCGCKVVQDTTIPVIQYCPKHEAAPELYEALKRLQGKFRTAAGIAHLSDDMIAIELRESTEALAYVKLKWRRNEKENNLPD